MLTKVEKRAVRVVKVESVGVMWASSNHLFLKTFYENESAPPFDALFVRRVRSEKEEELSRKITLG